MSQYVIVTNEVNMDERYLVEIPAGFNIEVDSEFGPLEYAQAHGEYIGVGAESFGRVCISRLFDSRAQAFGSLNDVITPLPAGNLNLQQRADIKRRIADYVFELTPGDVRSLISEDEAEQAASDILQMVLAEFSAKPEDHYDR